ncbi:coiled-coil domain-containing protein 3-like [Ptychodera flava]|uniref:coiled-coil domain-containing protein 3-like n=1 Tax=Ptychodera flava TaxID=63121 RepID=UPI00396A3691
MYCSRCSVLFMSTLVALSFTVTKHTAVLACSLVDTWRPQSFLRRAAQADIIAYGKVIDLTPIEEHPLAWPGVYDALFEFYCVLRGSTTGCPVVGPDQFGICVEECGAYIDSECTGNELCCSNGCGHVCTRPVTTAVINSIETVRDMGELTTCSRSVVQNGTNYVILLRREGDDLFPDEVNTESAVFPDTEEIWDDLSILCDFDTIDPQGDNICPSNVTMYKLREITDVPCYSAKSALTASLFAILAMFLGHVFLNNI